MTELAKLSPENLTVSMLDSDTCKLILTMSFDEEGVLAATPSIDIENDAGMVTFETDGSLEEWFDALEVISECRNFMFREWNLKRFQQEAAALIADIPSIPPHEGVRGHTLVLVYHVDLTVNETVSMSCGLAEVQEIKDFLTAEEARERDLKPGLNTVGYYYDTIYETTVYAQENSVSESSLAQEVSKLCGE